MGIFADRIATARHRLSYIPEAVVLISFLLLFVFFSIFAPHFLTPLAIGNILTFGSITGIIVIGVGLLMVSGEFDLSVGSNFALASYVLAISLNSGLPVILGILFAIIISTFLGFVNGIIVTKTNIPSFIATLGTMLAYRGIVRAVGGGSFASYRGSDIPIFKILNGDFTFLNNIFHVQAFRTDIIWFILLAIIFIIILMRTTIWKLGFCCGWFTGSCTCSRCKRELCKSDVLHNHWISSSNRKCPSIFIQVKRGSAAW